MGQLSYGLQCSLPVFKHEMIQCCSHKYIVPEVLKIFPMQPEKFLLELKKITTIRIFRVTTLDLKKIGHRTRGHYRTQHCNIYWARAY